MIHCEAELCPYWTGQGCICAVLDLAPDDLAGATEAEDYRDEKWRDAAS